MATPAISQQPIPATTTLSKQLRRLLGNYVVRKILKALLTTWAVTTFTFFLIRLLPGNPIEQFVNQLIVTYGIPYISSTSITKLSFIPKTPTLNSVINHMSTNMINTHSKIFNGST